MAEIRLDKVTKRFGQTVAVDHMSLQIADGEFVVFLGPSGCGKTTTLRAVAGLETVDEGDIFIGEKRVNNLRPADRDIAFVFQFYALYPHLTVYENIAFPLRASGMPKQEIDSRVRSVAATLHIDDQLNRKPSRLSGGEMQRVALGRAMVRRPKVFLMDEPLTNLDAKLRIVMRAELKHLQHELKTTTIYVTHDQIEAMSLGDRIAVMNQGRLQQIGTPEEIYHRPENLFVAGFVGSPPMNLLDIQIADSRMRFEQTDVSLPLPDQAHQALDGRKRELVLGIRPEDIMVETEKPSAGGTAAQVHLVEPLGSDTLLDLRLGTTAESSPLLMKARVPPTMSLEEGVTVWFRIEPEHLHFFDRQTEQILWRY